MYAMFSLGISELFILLVMIGVMAVPVILILMVVKMLTADTSGKRGTAVASETRLIQDIHAGLARLEERVEALETILIDRAGKETADRE